MRARPVVPGRIYLVSRRCSDRRFFLRPSKETNAIVKYELVKYARRHGIRIHGYLAMSNHIHLVLTDPFGELPRFMRDFLREVAKAVGAEIGRWNGFWEPGTYSRVELLDAARVVASLGYTLANATLAGLVRRAHRWPGLTSIEQRFGEPVRAHRPETRYYRSSRQPKVVEMELATPHGMDAGELQDAVAQRVRVLEQRAAEDLARRGRKFLGERAVLRQDPYDSPTSWEKRRGRNPTFASTDRWKRIEASQRKRAWYEAYRDALAAFVRGLREVVFPAGTWLMVEQYGCRCEPFAAPS